MLSMNSHDTSNSEAFLFDKYVTIYEFDNTYTDSSLVSEQWFLGDSILKKTGESFYRLPLESAFLDEWSIKSAKGQTCYETFDSLICQAGGASAWNKYLFIYDNEKRPLFIKHYKAWYHGFDEDYSDPEPEKPKYFLSETIKFQYNNSEVIQITKNDSGKVIEKITKRVDNKSRLEFEEIDGDGYEYRVYYKYEK